MRILHLVSYPLFSGPMPATLALAQAQRRRGHSVWLAYDSRRGNFDGFEEAAEPHLGPAQLSPPLARPLTLSTHASLSQHLADYQTLRAFLRPQCLDIVHSHLSHDHALAAVSKSARLPLVRTVHAARALAPRLGQRWLMRRAQHVIVRSKAHHSRLSQLLGTPDARAFAAATTIPGSIDAALWRQPDEAARTLARQRFRAAHHIPEQVPLLGHVALMAHRGQAELLSALATQSPGSFAQLHVVFVGDGEQARTLKSDAARQQLGQRVHFTGYLSAPALKQAYAAMDAALVMQAGNDAAVRAALEAMACGLPVLAPPIDALGELVDEETGFVLNGRSAQAVAEGIEAWLGNMLKAQARGRQAAVRIGRQRHMDREAEATLAVYSRCLAAPGA